MFLYRFFICLLFLLSGCKRENSTSVTYSPINGRSHVPIYRAVIPLEWMRLDPDKESDNSDTTQAIVEFKIHSDDEVIRVTVHNFPSDNIKDRIPPSAQIARWQK